MMQPPSESVKSVTGRADRLHHFFRRLLVSIAAPWNTSATRFWVVGDPADYEGMEAGFVSGRDTPEVFLADDPRESPTLTNDQITYKVRFDFGACIVK